MLLKSISKHVTCINRLPIIQIFFVFVSFDFLAAQSPLLTVAPYTGDSQMLATSGKPQGVNSQYSSFIDVDYRKLISRADLVYDTPVTRSEEGQPIGNGIMGSLVWTIPSSLKFQINRVDVFGNNSASNNFYERHTDYCGGTGYVDIDFGEEIFTNPHFRQHLSCYDGLSTVQGNEVEAKILAWHEQDVIAVKVEDSRKNPYPIFVNLRMLRSPVTQRGNHSAISKIHIVEDKIVLTQEFKEDNYYCGSAVVIGATGRKITAELINESTVRLTATPGNEAFSLFISSAASFEPEEDLIASAVQKLEAAQKLGFEGLFKDNQNWWHTYWKKAFVHLNSVDKEADLVEINYNYYLYVMASSSRGTYPTKFNGMLWTTGGDPRKWGGLYWGANQSCLYNAVFPTNRIELMDPMFNMYSKAYTSFAKAATQQWGSQGIYIPETHGFDGMPELPEDIAEEMQKLYLLQKPWEERSEAFKDYAYTKLPFSSRWNWKKDDGWKEGRWHMSDKGGGPFGHVTHIFSRGAKIAYQYWLRYEYTLDKNWLKDKAYPMLKGVAEFYRNFPNMHKGEDGKYSIHHINDNEAVWGAKNTVEEISAMMGIFPAAIKAAEILNVDKELLPVWKEFMSNIAPLPLSTDHPETASGSKVTWIKAIPPFVHGEGNRSPDPNTMPVWFFDLCNLESDPSTLKIANETYDTYFPNGITENTNVYVLSKLAVAGTILGRAEATRYLIPNQIRTAESDVMANRMDLREGFQTTSIQRLGRTAEALHYSLCQSVPAGPGEEPVISVFPAWPEEWNARFTLLNRGGHLVTSSFNNGTVEFVEILSQAGEQCTLKNPWPGKEVAIYRNNKKLKTVRGVVTTFKTKLNDHFVLIPAESSFPRNKILIPDI